MTSLPKITIDTNGLINLLDTESSTRTSVEELKKIINYSLSGKIDVAVTTRVESDLSEDKSGKRGRVIKEILDVIPVIGSGFTLNESKLGSPDVLVDESIQKFRDELGSVLFPTLDKKSKSYLNKQRDIDHILGHYLNQRDYFITDDIGILKKAETLSRSYGICVCSPSGFITIFDQLNSNSKIILSDLSRSEYRRPQDEGIACFDYSNNNGLFILGDGVSMFGTKWSKASGTSIHVYNNHSSIEGIAIAKGVNNIDEISDALSYDYSSRLRTLSLDGKHEIIVFKNINGMFAAVKLLSIKDDSRGDDKDEVRFEYRILKNGGKDFRKIKH